MNESNHLLAALTREGVLIKASVCYWRANKKLRPEDLGLESESVNDRLISLGHKRLLPKESLQEFALIESRVHGLIESSAFPFLNGLANFLPNSKLEEVTSKLKTLEEGFEACKSKFLEGYEGLRQTSLQNWEEAAAKLVARPADLVSAIDDAFPTPEKLQRHFKFDVQFFQISLPENLQTDLISLKDQEKAIEARQAVARNAARKFNENLNAFVSDCIASMREQTAVLCEEMLQSMQNGSKGVHQKTLNRLIRFIDEFKQLNFANDQRMEEQLERVRQQFLVRKAEDYRGDEEARERLKEGLRGLADTARQLAQQDNHELVERFGRMGHRKILKAA